jgi:FkbM family methyltransferase
VAAQPTQDEAQRAHAFFGNSGKGFFAEVGIRAGSPTWPLEKAGWTGVLVEPSPDVAAFLVTARTAKVFATACVAPDVAGQPLSLRVASPLASVEVGQPAGTTPSSYVVTVQTRTLDDILREAEAPAPIDLLVLDVYGRELDALLGFDFERWRPKLIVIADPVANLQRHRFLKESGYRLIRRGSGRGWYVPADAPVASEHWAMLRDYYLLLPFRMAWQALRRLNARIMAMPD